MVRVEKTEKAKTKARAHDTSLQKRKKDATRDSVVKDITAC